MTFLRKLLRELDLRYRFHWNSKCNHATGKAYPNRNRIDVWVYKAHNLVEAESGYDRFTRKRLTLQEFLSVVFHEVAHILCAREGRFETYLRSESERMSQARFNVWARQILPAERYADRLGAKLMARYFPEIPFLPAYDGERGENFVKARVRKVAEHQGLRASAIV